MLVGISESEARAAGGTGICTISNGASAALAVVQYPHARLSRGGCSMLLVGRHRTRTCQGVTRRELLQVGASSVLGLSALDLLRRPARAGAVGGKAKSVMLLWLWGGPAQLDT